MTAAQIVAKADSVVHLSQAACRVHVAEAVGCLIGTCMRDESAVENGSHCQH